MKKKELLEKLKDLPDDAVIYVECCDCGSCMTAHDVVDINTGADGTEPEATILGA